MNIAPALSATPTTPDNMATIHIQVPQPLKGIWTKASRELKMKLSTYVQKAIEQQFTRDMDQLDDVFFVPLLVMPTDSAALHFLYQFEQNPCGLDDQPAPMTSAQVDPALHIIIQNIMDDSYIRYS